MYFVIMGSPGSGKTTLAHKLAKDMNGVTIISCGDLYRKHGKYNNDLKKASGINFETWLAGLHQFIIDEIAREIQRTNTPNYIIDGLWKENLEMFEQNIGKIDKIYYLMCPYNLAYERLMARQRHDDYPAKIQKRLRSYFDREPECLLVVKKYPHKLVGVEN